MKAYGLPRIAYLEYPDVGDIQEFGLKSSVGHLRGKGGDIKSYFRNSAVKRSVRRRHKRAARREGKNFDFE